MASGGSDGSLRFDTRVDTTGFEQGISTLSGAARTLQSDMERAGNSIQRSFNGNSRMTALNNQIEQTEAKIRRLTDEMAELGRTQIPTEEYKWYQDQIDAANRKLEGLISKQQKLDDMGESHNSSRWKNLQYDIDQVTRQLEVYRSEMQQLEADGEAFTSGADSAAYTDKANRIQQLTSQLEVYRQRLLEVQANEENVRTPLQKFVSVAQSAFRNITRSTLRLARTIGSRIVSAFNSAARSAIKFAGSIGSKMSSGIRNFVSGSRKMSSASNGVSRSILRLSNMFKMLLIRMAMRAVIQGVKEGFQNLVQYSAEANATVSSLMSSMFYLKNSFAAAFAPILSVVAPALNTLISMIATALNYINQFFSALGGKTTFIKAKKVNQDYAKSLKGTGGAAKQAGKAAKQAGQEAKKALAPFDDLIQIQLDANKDHSGSGGGAGGGGAGGISPANMFETAEINKGISDFAKQLKDMFNAGDFAGIGKLIGEKINDAVAKFTDFISWDRIGGKITAFVTAFTTMFNSLVATIDWHAIGALIGTGVNTIVHTLYLLLTQIDWYALGRAVADGLNGIVDTIEWDLFGATIGEYFKARIEGLRGFVEKVNWEDIGNAIATSLNNMIAHIPWEKLGLLIAESFNGIIKGLRKAVERFEWSELGNNIALGLNTAVNNISWENLGLLIAEGFNGVLRTLLRSVEGFDWSELGSNMALGLNTAMDTISWEDIGLLVAESFNGVFNTFYTVVDEFEWSTLGEHIGTSLSTLFTNFEFGTVAESLSLFVTGILDTLINIVQTTDWSKLAVGIETMLTSIDWLGIASRLATLFFSAIGMVFGVLARIVADLIIKGFTKARDYFGKEIEDCGGNVVLGFLKGIKDALVGIATWVYTNMIKPFVDGVKNGFGIHSPSKVMEEIGTYLWEGFCKGIKSTFAAPINFIKQNITDPFMNGVKGLLGIHSPSTVMQEVGGYTVEGFNQGVSQKQSSTQSVIQSWAKGIGDWFASKLGISSGNSTEAQRWATGTVTGFNQGVTINYKSTQSAIEAWGNSIRLWFVSSGTSKGINKESWEKFALDIITGFKNKITSSFRDTQSPVELWADSIRKWFVSSGTGKGVNKESWEKFALDIITSFKNKISGSFKDTQKPIEVWSESIRKWFISAGNSKGVNKESWEKFALDIITAFKTKIQQSYKDVQVSIDQWADNIRKWFISTGENKGVNKESWTKFALDIITAFKAKIEQGHNASQTSMQTWSKHVAEWFWGDSNVNGNGGLYQSFYNMAKRVNEGFEKGISDFAHLAKDAIRRWARETLAEAEDELDIHSPSREFHSIAEYVVKGFNEGIADMAKTSVSEARKWLNNVTDVFDGVDIGVPIGLNIPNASSYIPNVAKGKITPTGAGYVDTLKASYENRDDVLGILADKMQASNGSAEPSQIVIKFDSSLGALARLLKPELDKEAKRKGVSLVLVGGN